MQKYFSIGGCSPIYERYHGSAVGSMRIIFFGLGSIGQRHAKILQKYFEHELYAFRHQRGAKNPLGIKEVYSWDEVRKIAPDVAFITNPTSEHVKTATRAIASGMHIFMEKPLTNKLDELSRLEREIKKSKVSFYTAYCLRFHPVIKKIKELIAKKKVYHSRIVCASYLPHWRPGQSHKANYSALRKFGGGVFLDISHELDYVEFLLGPIASMTGSLNRLSNVTVDVEDTADIVTIQKSGAKVNLHLDYLSRQKERTMKIDFDGGYIAADLLKGHITYAVGNKIEEFKFKVDTDEFFREQLEYFFKNLKNVKIMNNFSDSRNFIEKLLTFKKTCAKKFY
jgi:predicted dehydrogenase